MPEATPAGPDADERALRELEDRLARATAAAERLLSETAAEAAEQARAGADEVPPAGWQRAGADREAASARWIDPGDATRLLAVLSAVLDRVPLELQQRVVGALRELLLAVRALIDWCLERAERRRGAPVEVQDIPIL